MKITRPQFTLKAKSGPLTDELVRKPGQFGIGQTPARLDFDATTTMVCGFCSTGCGLNIHLKDGEAINLSADSRYPVNLGMACPKGWEALAPLSASDRVTSPMMRIKRDGKLVPVDWDAAMKVFCGRMKAIAGEYGHESVAFLSTGQITTEEMALLGCLYKFGMGFLHCDSNTRQCMATAHVAYKQSFGFDAPPFTYADFEESDALIFIGANPCIAHPIMWQRVMRNPNNPEIVVIDPRATETAMAATQHLAIKPKSDLVFLYGLANWLIEHEWIDRKFIAEHTSQFEAFAEFVKEYTPERVTAECGISGIALSRLARVIHEGKRVSFWWTMGINQGHESTRTAQAIINLALMTGNIGRPGTGANSITGQCNAMGSRVFGNITSLLGGHDATKPEHRAKIANILGIDEEVIPRTPPMTYDQIVQGIEDGKIKALWVIATNGSHSWVDQKRFTKLMEKLEFLVVQDMYATTESAETADLILPAAGWGEKDGTFINSERRIGVIKKVMRAPGSALSDFNIFKLVAQYWGCGEMFERWSSPEAAFQLLREVSRGQPCEFTGIDGYRDLDEHGGIQWPFRGPEDEGQQRRLFEDGRFYTADGRAVFHFESPRPMPEPPDAEYPFFLLTGRGTSSQWHTGTRTGKSDVLRKLYPADCYIEIHPDDAKRLRIPPNARVKISSRRGTIQATAAVVPTVQRGQVFLPMHYREVNQLTMSAFDPYSRQPSFKACAVKIGLA